MSLHCRPTCSLAQAYVICNTNIHLHKKQDTRTLHLHYINFNELAAWPKSCVAACNTSAISSRQHESLIKFMFTAAFTLTLLIFIAITVVKVFTEEYQHIHVFRGQASPQPVNHQACQRKDPLGWNGGRGYTQVFESQFGESVCKKWVLGYVVFYIGPMFRLHFAKRLNDGIPTRHNTY